MKTFIQKFGIRIFVSLIIAAAVFVFFGKEKKAAQNVSVNQEKHAVEVRVNSVADLKQLANDVHIAGMVVGDQEARIVAQANGVVKSLNFDLGDSVQQGKVVLTIDDQGSLLADGKNDFASAQVQRLELAVKQAKKAYNLANDNYDRDKSDANKTARDIAKIQYESAQVDLDNALNARIVTAPISGTVSLRNVSLGDSVSVGQVLATISRTSNSKIQLFLSTEEVKNVHVGSVVKVTKDGKEIDSKIINISPQADSATRKFLVEVQAGNGFLLGEIVDVSVTVSGAQPANGSIFLPLSAITSSQIETYVFVAENGVAKKVPVTIANIAGEIATVQANLPDQTQIIVEGNKLIADQDKIQIK